MNNTQRQIPMIYEDTVQSFILDDSTIMLLAIQDGPVAEIHIRRGRSSIDRVDEYGEVFIWLMGVDSCDQAGGFILG